MKLLTALCIAMLMALTACVDTPANKREIVNSTDKNHQIDNDISAIALAYLTKNRTELGIDDPANDLKIIKITKDEYQTQHVKYAQRFKSIPVWASEIIVHIKGNKVYSANGDIKTIQKDFSVVPKISSTMAEQSAFKSSSGQYVSQLMVLAEENNTAKLTYLVELRSGLSRYMVFVDANNGEVIKELNAMPNT